MDLGSSTELITLRPWCTGKQLPLGLSVLGQNRKENYGIYILDNCTNSGACSIFIYGALGIKAQASSTKLDKLQAVGYYRIRKRGHMNSKEIKWTIDRLDDGDWQRMKEHMDKKFPNMKLPDIQSFKELVRLYGLTMEHHEKKLN